MKKLGILTMVAALGISGLAVGSINNAAVAGAVPTCDAGVITINKTDAATGGVLGDATFRIKTADDSGLYLVSGDASAQETTFKEAWNGQFADDLNESTPQGGAELFAAYVDEGEMPDFPVDITGIALSGADRDAALDAFQKDKDGKIAALEAYVDGRIALVDAALAANDRPEFEAMSPEAFADANAVDARLAQIKADLTTIKTTDNWDEFVTAYTDLVDGAAWRTGISQPASAQYVDFLNGVNNKAAFDAATDAVIGQIDGATKSVDVTTAEDGTVQFTVLGVADGYQDNWTRGLNTCEQLIGDAVEIEAPAGYVLDTDTQNWLITDADTKTGSLDIANTPIDYVSPEGEPMGAKTGE